MPHGKEVPIYDGELGHFDCEAAVWFSQGEPVSLLIYPGGPHANNLHTLELEFGEIGRFAQMLGMLAGMYGPKSKGSSAHDGLTERTHDEYDCTHNEHRETEPAGKATDREVEK